MNDGHDKILAQILQDQIGTDLVETDDFELKKLHETTERTRNEDNPITQYISDMYFQRNKRGQPHIKLSFKATLFDACVTQMTTEFLLSFDIWCDLIKNNVNLNRQTCSRDEYKIFVLEMMEANILKQLTGPIYVEPTPLTSDEIKAKVKPRKGKWKAGTYQLTFKPVVDYIDGLNQAFCDSVIAEECQILKLVPESN